MSIVPTNPIPENIFRDFASILDMFDRVLPVTPALEGAATSQESGILFEMRHAVTKLGTYRLYKNWQQFLNDKAEAWYNQAGITYKDIYRKVKRTDASGFVEFNKVDYRNGQRVYINSIEQLPRAEVNVHLANSSPTEQMSKRLQLFDMNKIFAANPELFKPQIRVVNHELLKTLDLSPEEKEYQNMLFEIQKQIDVVEEFTKLEGLKSSIAQSKAATAQSQAMVMQLNAQMAQATGQAAGPPESVTPAGPQLPPPEEAAQGALPPEGFVSEGEPAGAAGQAINTSRGSFQP